MSQLPQLSPGSGSIMSSPRGSSLPEEQDHLHEPSINVLTQTSLDGDCESQDAVHEKENMTQQESALLLRHDDGFASDVPLAVDTASGKPGATPSSSSCAHIGNMEELGQTAVVARLAALLQLGQTSVVGCGKRARQEDKSVHSDEPDSRERGKPPLPRLPGHPALRAQANCRPSAEKKLKQESGTERALEVEMHSAGGEEWNEAEEEGEEIVKREGLFRCVCVGLARRENLQPQVHPPVHSWKAHPAGTPARHTRAWGLWSLKQPLR